MSIDFKKIGSDYQYVILRLFPIDYHLAKEIRNKYSKHHSIRFIFWGCIHNENCYTNACSETGQKFESVDDGLEWASQITKLTDHQISGDQYHSDVIIFAVDKIGYIFSEILPYLQNIDSYRSQIRCYEFDQIEKIQIVNNIIIVDLVDD